MTKVLDWNKYIIAARNVVQEGCVLLENKDQVLPLKKKSKVAIFGRIQHNYYKSGTGSGGLVNVNQVIGIVDGLKKSNSVIIDEQLENIYLEWEKSNPFEQGEGWGKEPWCQKEMPITQELANSFAQKNDIAIIIIGRSAGEDRDNSEQEGSWNLTSLEIDLLKKVSCAFENTVVILNTGNIIDMNFVEQFNIKSVLYTWQGGMIGGLGIADILTGRACPSGKLTDTIAKNISDYPAFNNFGDLKSNIYQEDIFIGYRYFETFAKDKVLYPFGFGLSYTNFKFESNFFEFDASKEIPKISVDVTVKNIGKYSGKEVIQLYVKQPQSKLGKSALVLANFSKTKTLKPNKSQTLALSFDASKIRSFDDTGVTGYKNCFVLEDGVYEIFAGNSVRNNIKVGQFNIDKTIVLEKVNEALYPVVEFERLKATCKNDDNSNIVLTKELVKASEPYQNKHRNQNLPELDNFLDNPSLNQKVVSILKKLTDYDLECIVRGEGMGSPKVTAGTAAAFGGISDELKSKGVPCGCCTDGPSGIRLDSGAQAFSLPSGTLQACTFNPSIVQSLYEFLGLELIYNKIDVILGPGINIRRHPLNGRNFEYFSEDPLVTGVFATSNILGLKKHGVSGSLKHFCCNNQETGRRTSDSIVSARALREIYLPGFESAIKNGADVIMTSYGAVNGLWNSGNYDLNTLILRKDWGFKGIVMTDWWPYTNDEGKEPFASNIAQDVRSQNDLYMVVPEASENLHKDNTLQSLKEGTLTRQELLRSAYNIIDFLQNSHAQKRFENCDVKIKIKNRVSNAIDKNADKIVYYEIKDGLTIDLSNVDTTRGSSFGFGFISKESKIYKFELLGKTGDNDLQQVNVGLSWNGVHITTLCWNGTHGEYVEKSLTAKRPLNRYTVWTLFFAQSGLTLKELKVTEVKN